MKADLHDFKTGWYGLTLGATAEEIEMLIAALQHLQKSKEHFHLRSEFEGGGGLGDVEFYFIPEGNDSGALSFEADFR